MSAELELIGVFVQRLTHQLVNNLSVAQSVVEDIDQGQLSDQESLADAKQALVRALELTQFVSPFASPSEEKSELIDLKYLLREVVLTKKYPFILNLCPEEIFIKSQKKIIIQILRYFISYLIQKCGKVNINDPLNLELFLKGEALCLRGKLCFNIFPSNKRGVFIGVNKFLLTDYSLEALGLVYIEQYLKKLNLGSLLVDISRDNELVLRINFKKNDIAR